SPRGPRSSRRPAGPDVKMLRGPVLGDTRACRKAQGISGVGDDIVQVCVDTERLSDSFEQSAYELVGIGGRQHVLSGFVQQLQQALGTALRAFRGRNRKRVADARRNALGRQRSFGQIIRDACLHQLDGNVLVAAAREGDDRRTRSGSPYLGKKGKAVDAGQIVIEENAVVRARAYLV